MHQSISAALVSDKVDGSSKAVGAILICCVCYTRPYGKYSQTSSGFCLLCNMYATQPAWRTRILLWIRPIESTPGPAGITQAVSWSQHPAPSVFFVAFQEWDIHAANWCGHREWWLDPEQELLHWLWLGALWPHTGSRDEIPWWRLHFGYLDLKRQHICLGPQKVPHRAEVFHIAVQIPVAALLID